MHGSRGMGGWVYNYINYKQTLIAKGRKEERWVGCIATDRASEERGEWYVHKRKKGKAYRRNNKKKRSQEEKKRTALCSSTTI